MKKHLIWALLCICTYIDATALPAGKRTDANIVGHVIDKNSGEHISYATVAIEGTTIGTSTDNSGHYYIKNIPEGNFIIEASMIGYKSETKKITIRSGETAEINFTLEEQSIAMDDVVVSASRSATKRRLAPALVSIVGPDVFERVNAANLAQGLGMQPGIRVENDCQNCGFTQVRINGLDGHYSQILVDSHPIFSALTGVYGLEQMPANMIERVEVMRGGGSALFGSSAIGGTINIITRDPLRNSATASHTITGIGGRSYDNNTSLNASLVTDNSKAGLYVYGQMRNRQGYDHDGDGFTELPVLESRSVGARSFLKTGLYSRLTLQYHHINEYRRGGDLLHLPPHEAMIAEQTDHTIDGGSLAFDISSADYANRFNAYVSFQNTDRKSYYGGGKDIDAYGTTHDITVATGMQYLRSFRRLWFMPAELTVGAEYNFDGLTDTPMRYTPTQQDVHITGLYIQNEWKNDKWSLLIGGRFDKHNLIDHIIFSPRANVRFNPTENINIRASYAGGFRAPQAFDEDMHISIVGGERVRIRLADDLREERSHSVSLSADMYRKFGKVQTNLLIEGFYTDLRNAFALRELPDLGPDGEVIKERYNGSGATVMGINIEAKAAFTSWFELQAGFTLQKSRYKQPEQWSENPDVAPVTKMFRTPNAYGYLTATVTPVRKFDIDLSGTYTGKMLVQHMKGSGTLIDEAVVTPSYFDLGAKISYEFSIYKEIGLQIYAGVQNIFNAYQKDFDRGATRDSGYIYGPSLPRSWYAGVKISF